MQTLLRDYFDGRVSRRGFLETLVAAGLTSAAATTVLDAAQAGAGEGSAKIGTLFKGTGGELLLEQVRAAGTRYVFSNPGSVEVGFFDALTDRPELQLIVGLHEGIVIAAADGFHKVSREPAFVNLHAAVGTAQASGQLYNAQRDGSVLVITAGMNDNTIYSDDIGLAPMAGFSQIEINRQFTKISWDVRTASSTALAIRRAYKLAATAPGGPVYVAFSRAAQSDPAQGDIWPRDQFIVQARPRPATDQIESLARMLLEAKQPLLMFGDEVWKAGAAREALALVEHVGAAAISGFGAYNYFPAEHPQRTGARYQTSGAYPFGGGDLVVQCGTRDLGGADIPGRLPIDPQIRFVAMGLDTNMLGRTQPLDLAVVGDLKEALKALNESVMSMATAERLARIRRDRLALVTPAAARNRAERLAQARQRFGETPIHNDRLAYELERGIDPNAIIVVENLAGNVGQHDFLRFGPTAEDKLGVSHTGNSLGWGVGAAVGAKLAAPDRQVVLSIGDGSLMYSAAGFWTMARYEVPVLTIVWNNHNYQTVRAAAHRYNRRMAETGRYHGLYLGDPDIDFVKLAESQGLRGERITSPADIAAALKRGTEETHAGRPYLLEFVVGRVGGGAESTWHQKFSVAALQPTRV